jgi:hypothetical protein
VDTAATPTETQVCNQGLFSGNNFINLVTDDPDIPGSESPTCTPVRLGPNQPPTASAGGPYSGDEGSAIALSSASALDPDGDALTFSWSVDSALCSFDDPTQLQASLTCDDSGSYVATLTADDGHGASTSSDAAITVDNVAPTVVSLTPAPADPVLAIGASITFNATFTDPAGVEDETYTCRFDWDGDGTVDGLIASAFGTCSGNTSYSTAGVYPVKVTIADKDDGVSNVATYEYVVVYETLSGFVTGSGWFDSPAGAYKPDPSLAGEARFGFVSRYHKGANIPTGKTRFQFRAGGLHFRSDAYEWLLVNQGGTRAQFKGTGLINGGLAPSGTVYKFMLWATDGAPDTLRVRIWWEDAAGTEVVVYDNGAEHAIGGGKVSVSSGQ